MSLRRLAFAASMLFVSSVASEVKAASPTLTVEYQVDMGRYGTHDYVYVEGLMSGSVTRADSTTGTYKVPFVMAYPKDGGNHVAFFDLPEVSWFILWRNSNGEVVLCGRGTWDVNLGGPVPCETTVPQGSRLEQQIVTNGIKAAEGYLFREGYTYFSAQYAKTVTEFFGPETPDGTPRRRLAYGTIERGFDSDEILKDVSRILRQPNLTGVAAVTHVLMYAFSAAGIRANGFLVDGQNGTAPNLFYDGFIITNNGAMYWINSEDPPVYAGIDFLFSSPPTNGAKVIRIDMEADLMGTLGYAARDPNFGTAQEDTNHVRWEIAGTAHLTPLIDDLQHMGATRQNPIDRFPIDRGAIAALKNWVVNGTTPPPTKHIEGSGDDMGNWTGTFDAEGNALGGVRLPHMRRTDAEGGPAGAPTGVYGGAETSINNINVFLGGTYEPFSAQVLATLYPSEAAYRTLYNKGAELVRNEGYITEEDYQKYITPPQDPPVIPPDPVDPPPEDTGCCSTASRNNPPVATFVLFLGMCLLGRANLRRRRRQ